MDTPPPSLTLAKPPEANLPWPDLLAGAAAVSRRLVAAHSRHFLALSSLLLLPLSLLLVSLPSPSLLPSTPSLQSPNPNSGTLPVVLLAGGGALLYLAAFAAVSGSVHAGFFGRPVRLLPSLFSLPCSLPRLLLTLAAASLPFLPLLLLPPSAAAGGIVLLLLLLAPFWSLAGAAAVVESTCGFRPLLRSCRLLSGLRCAALLAFLFFASAIGITLWGFGGVGGAPVMGDWAEVAPVVVKAVVGTAVVAALLLYGSVLNVVLYMHCKALHGELVGEIYDEFADTYVFLPFDESKERHVVSVAPPQP